VCGCAFAESGIQIVPLFAVQGVMAFEGTVRPSLAGTPEK